MGRFLVTNFAMILSIIFGFMMGAIGFIVGFRVIDHGVVSGMA